jgi:acetolactate synthase-1/3 small subunit
MWRIPMEMKKTISVLVENQPGVLARIAGLFSGRAFNIDSLAVGETEDPQVSRMTIVARGEEQILEQIVKQLNKLIDVIKVIDMTAETHIEREMALVKVGASKKKAELMGVLKIFKAKVLDVSKESYLVEVTGDDEKISSFVEAVSEFGVKEMVRTGTVAMARSKKGKK